jgi:molecular chaperone HscB
VNINFQDNFFAIFQLPVSYQVEPRVLDDRYRDLQRSVHPDKHVGASDQDKRLSMQWATVINEAYTTLKSPLKRAIYILKLKACDIEHNPTLPGEFLMAQIDLREELEDIGDYADGLTRLALFKAKIASGLAVLESDFAAQIDDQLAAAEQTTYKMQFMHKLYSEADRLEEKLLDY